MRFYSKSAPGRGRAEVRLLDGQARRGGRRGLRGASCHKEFRAHVGSQAEGDPPQGKLVHALLHINSSLKVMNVGSIVNNPIP